MIETRYSPGGISNQELYETRCKPVDPTIIRDSDFNTTNRLEVYEVHRMVLKCAVFKSNWHIILAHKGKIYEGRGKNKRDALKKAEQQWREDGA